MHRITQEIPRRARVFGYGPFTLYGAAFQKLHLTFALPRRAPTTPSYFKPSADSALSVFATTALRCRNPLVAVLFLWHPHPKRELHNKPASNRDAGTGDPFIRDRKSC